MGRRKTPTSILAARGSIRAQGRKGEPDFRIEIPPCPKWVKLKLARDWYKEQAEYAAEAGIMSAPFGTALAGAAFYLQEFIQCEKGIVKQGRTNIAQSGAPYQNPLVGIRNKAWDKVLRVLVEFGYTPAARSSIKVGATKQAANSLQSFNDDEREA